MRGRAIISVCGDQLPNSWYSGFIHGIQDDMIVLGEPQIHYAAGHRRGHRVGDYGESMGGNRLLLPILRCIVLMLDKEEEHGKGGHNV